MKMEIKSLKKNHKQGTLEMKNLGTWTGITEAIFTNRIQAMEERISGIEDTIEEVNTSVKENVEAEKIKF